MQVRLLHTAAARFPIRYVAGGDMDATIRLDSVKLVLCANDIAEHLQISLKSAFVSPGRRSDIEQSLLLDDSDFVKASLIQNEYPLISG